MCEIGLLFRPRTRYAGDVMDLRRHFSWLRLGQIALLTIAALNIALVAENARLRGLLKGGTALVDAAKAPDFMLPRVGSDRTVTLREVTGRTGTLLFFSPDCSV